MPTTFEQLKITQSSATAARTNGTVNGTGVDTKGSASVVLLIIAGVITDGSHVITVEESSTSGGAYTAIPAARITNGSLPTLTTGANSNTLTLVGVATSPGNPFIRVVITTSAATTGGIVGTQVIYAGNDGAKLPV